MTKVILVNPASHRLLIVMLFVLAGRLVAVRLVGLGQYPKVHPDEGFWACGSRNLVLYGDGLMDGRLHPFLSPATFILLSGVFSVVPPDLVSARATSAVLGLLSVGLFAGFTWRRFSARPWLIVVLFGLSSLAVLIQRMILLEAHQMFWLVVAAGCWLSSSRRLGPVAAGFAFALALLVKSNSIYLLPAFLLTLPAAPGRGRCAGLFLGSCLALAGGGYFLAWRLWPIEFVHAFQYELAGDRWADADTLFRVWRFGLHPPRALAAVRQLLARDGLLVAGGLAGLALVASRLRSSRRDDRFFALWLVLGLSFVLGQIFVKDRYLTTLAPGLAYLSALSVEALLARPRVFRVAAVVLLVGFSLSTLVRVSVGLAQQPCAEYWQVVGWMRREAPHDARVLAASVIDLSLPQRGYDFFRAVVPYDGGPRRLIEDIVQKYEISYIIIDPEWRHYEDADMAYFVARRCVPREQIGSTTIYEVAPVPANALPDEYDLSSNTAHSLASTSGGLLSQASAATSAQAGVVGR